MVRFPMPLYHAGRLIFGLGGGDASPWRSSSWRSTRAPVHKKIFKSYTYESKPPFGLGLDHQWLGFFQYETGGVFVQYDAGGPRSVPHLRRRADPIEPVRSPRASG